MRAHLLLLGLVALPSFGCGDPPGPSPDNLQVSVSTAGVDKDNDYSVRAGEGPARPIQASLLLSLPPGEHDVVLEGIAPNCSVQGPNSIRVTIRLGEVADAAFQVECRAVTGAIQVSAPTSGQDLDADGYTVHVDDELRTRVFPGGRVVIEGMLPGTYVVRLDDFSENCRLSGSANQSVLVTAGGLTRDTVRTTFEASCQAFTGDVQLLTTTGGGDPDANGYTVMVDGQLEYGDDCGFYGCYLPLLLVPNGSYLFTAVPSGDHTYELGDIAPNCTVNGSNPRTVPVAFGETSVVLFDVTCTDVS